MDSTEETKNEPKSNGMIKKEEKARKRDIRTLENVLKKFGKMTESEKHEGLKGKYKELYDENRNLQSQVDLITKTMNLQETKLEKMKVEYTKSTFVCNRLENVCRELQNQNKIFKEQNMTKIKENEEMHKKVVSKFEGALTELSEMLQDNNEDNIKLKNDNMDMLAKMTCLGKEFEKSQVEMNKMSEKMNLEKLLFEAKYNKINLELTSEREQWINERKLLETKLKKSEENCARLEDIVKTLGGNLDSYTTKFKEFHSSISKSHTVIYDCKNEMKRLSNQNSLLETELDKWKTRFENKSKSFIELENVKKQQESQLGVSERKLEQLKKLCRQLQVDRAAYLKLLKDNNIEPTTQICVDTPQPQPAAPTPIPKPTKKELELQQLKSNLKFLQEKVEEITNNSVNNGDVDSNEEKNKIQIEAAVDTTDKIVENNSLNVKSSFEQVEEFINKVDPPVIISSNENIEEIIQEEETKNNVYNNTENVMERTNQDVALIPESGDINPKI